jgi:hypothetical protein
MGRSRPVRLATDRVRRGSKLVVQNAPVLALGLVVVSSVLLLLLITAQLTFFQDTWEFLINRRAVTWDALMRSHNEHIVAIPVAIELILLRIFGMTSAMPEYVLQTLFLAISAILVFAYVRRRLGPWPGLMAAALLLFLGPAWQDLIWPFEIGFIGSVLFGVAMLLALDRDEPRWDIVACACLVTSMGFSSLGIAFAAGAVVNVFQRRHSRGLGRAYVAAIPILLYAIWWLGWGHDAETHLTLHNVLSSPPYVMESLAASIAALLGLSTLSGAEVLAPEWGRPLLVAFIVLAVYRQIRKPGFPPSFWPVAAAAATSWFLAAFNFIPGREAYASRYLYAGAAFVILLAANLLQGVRFGKWALLVAGLVTIAAVASNLVPLKEGKEWLEGQTVLTRADLAAIEIAERTVDPSFSLTPEIAGTPSLIDVRAGEYLTAVREYGSPAYTPAELAGAPESGRAQADVVLANALPVTTETKPGAATTSSRDGCVEIPGGAGASAPSLDLPPGATTIELAPGGSATIGLRRFATNEYPLETEGVPGDSTTTLEIAPDRVARPWHLRVEASQTATVCRRPG